MLSVNYEKTYNCVISPEIIDLLLQIYEYKGRYNLLIEQNTEELEKMIEIAKIENIDAFCKIENIGLTDERIRLISKNKTIPRSMHEHEIVNYRDVLTTINENYNYIPVKFSMILQLHSDLYKSNSENVNSSFRWETAEDIEEMCNYYKYCINNKKISPLIIIPMFIIDFISINAFDIGNERMGMILMYLLFNSSNFIVGKYISIEKIIQNNYDRFISVLNLDDNTDMYLPFIKYILGVILEAYKEFEKNTDIMISKDFSKPERIAELIKQHSDEITKREIMEKCTDISDTTIQRTLNNLLKSNKIVKIRGGRYTKYIWNIELEN